ncbi:MAG: hypothetical protein ABIZ70_03780 [Gemmatimonadales bacterium]
MTTIWTVSAPRGVLSTILSTIGIVGMFAAAAYGGLEVRRLDREYLSKADSLAVLTAQGDSLQRDIDHLRTGSLQSLLTPRAVAVPANRVACTPDYDGLGRDSHGMCAGYGFMLWLELPYSRRAEIRSVSYFFSGHTTTPVRIGTDPSNGFLVGWLGWAPWVTIPVTVETRDGAKFSLELPMEELVRTSMMGGT